LPKHYYRNIDLTKGIAISLVISVALITYYTYSIKDTESNKKDYIEKIIKGFDSIDNYFINNYDDNTYIIKLLYKKINIPSSDQNDDFIFNNMNVDEKDSLFLIYNKITYNLEKIFVLDPKLFDNNNLGMRIRLYIDSLYYFEFWKNSNNLFKTEFVDFMNNKYDFLKPNNSIYNKPNNNMNRVSIPSSIDFINNSSLYNNQWF
jgi:hypothetical protein